MGDLLKGKKTCGVLLRCWDTRSLQNSSQHRFYNCLDSTGEMNIEILPHVVRCIKVSALLCFSMHTFKFFLYFVTRLFDAYSIYELLPQSVMVGEVGAGHGQLEELPLPLRLHHLSGELRGPRRVGESVELDFIS